MPVIAPTTPAPGSNEGSIEPSGKSNAMFSWPGVGKWLVEAVRRRDYPTLQGGVLLVATVVIAVNVTVDLLYGLINPRIRHHN